MAAEFREFHEYEHIFNQAPCGVGIFQIDTGRPVFLNNAYFDIIGYSREEYEAIARDQIERLVYTTDLPISEQSREDFFRQGEASGYEYRVVRKNGEVRWVKLGLNEIEIEGIKYAFAFFVDFTNEKENYIRLTTISENIESSISMFRITREREELIYANPSFYRLIGVEEEKYREKTYEYDRSFVSIQDQQRINSVVSEAMKSGKPGMIEHKFCRPDGTVLWLSRRYVAVRQDKEGEYLLISVVSDITRQKVEQIKNLIDKQRFELVIRELNAAIFEWNFEDGSFYSSEAFHKYAISKASTDDILKNSGSPEYVHPDDYEALQQFFRDTDSGADRAFATLRLKMIDGSYRWCRMVGLFYRDENGNRDRTIGMLLDINEEREQSFMLSSLLNGLPGGVVIFKYARKLECQYYSDGFARLSGRTREEVDELLKAGNLFETAIAPSDVERFTHEMYSSMAAGRPINLTCRYPIRNKGVGWLHVTGTKLREQDGCPVYYCIFTNPTDETALYRNIVEEADTGIFIAERKNRRILFMNEQMGKLFGVAFSRLQMRMTNSDPLPQEYAVLKMEEVMALQEDRYTEFHVVWKDKLHLKIHAKALNWNGIDAYILYFMDESAEYEQQMRLQTLIDNVPAGIGIFEIRNGILSQEYINDAYYTMLGMSRESRSQYEGDNALAAVSLEDRPITRSHIQKLLEGADRTTLQIRLCNGKGEWKWFNLTVSVITRKATKIKIYVAFSDCDEMMKTQQEREQHYEEQLRLKKIAAREALATATLNLTQNIVIEAESRRPELSHIMQCTSVDEMLEGIRQNTIGDEEKTKFLQVCNVAAMLKTFKEGTTHVEIRHHLRSSTAWVQSTFDMIQNPFTGDVEAIATLRDISDAARAELVVKRLLEVDYEAIMTLDLKTAYVRTFQQEKANETIQKMLSMLEKQKGAISVMKDFYEKHAVPEDRERAVRENTIPYITRMLEQAPIFMSLFSMMEGERIIHIRVIYAYLDESKETILCAVQDVTDTYEQEEKQRNELMHALQIAENANRARREFLSRMSHDMRTPMNGIIGLAELSVNEQDPEVLRANMSKIKESGEYLLGLINDTLDFQKIESGKMTLNRQIIYAAAAYDNILDMIRPLAEEKSIDLKITNHNADLDMYIRIDPVRIKQIIFNLLSNAIKFTPDGGSVSMDIRMLSREGMISHNCIQIADTGIGMSSDFIQNGLYRPFSQEQTAVSAQYVGSGLGLSIVHSLVEMMGGRMEVESRQGEGTTFTLYLDFERVETQEAQKLEKVTRGKEFVLTEELCGKRILLVEDHPLNAQIAMKWLEKAGCEVMWADNGQKAVQAYRASDESRFDAILMDVRMPVMTGLEATEEIRKSGRPDALTIPIIAMTANAYEEDVQKSIAAGMNAHLAKPMNPGLLYVTLAGLINKGMEQETEK